MPISACRVACEGGQWGLALLVARLLGEEMVAATAVEMAERSFLEGSPLHTLCMVLGGAKPDQVFPASSSSPGSQMVLRQVAGGPLSDWMLHVAMLATNRTLNDDRVLTALGQQLAACGKVRGDCAEQVSGGAQLSIPAVNECSLRLAAAGDSRTHLPCACWHSIAPCGCPYSRLCAAGRQPVPASSHLLLPASHPAY